MATAQALRLPEGDPVLRADPAGALAVGLVDLARARQSVIHVAASERRAESLARVVEALAPDLDVVYFPPWDCLPYDRASPSRAVMGQRAAALGRLAQPASRPRLLVSVSDALVQRVPPPETWDQGTWTLRVGQAFEPADLEAHLGRTGYVVDDRVDEPGEVAFRGEVIDICPGAAAPCRVEHEEGLVTAIRSFDPVTQRTTGDLEEVIVGPASEVVFPRDAEPSPPEREAGMEHRLPDHYPGLATVFDYLPEATVVLDARAEQRVDAVLEQIGEAQGGRARLAEEQDGPTKAIRISAAARLYLGGDEWSAQLRDREVLRPGADGDDLGVPRFATQKGAGKAFAAFVKETLGRGRRLVLAAAGPSARTLHRRAEAAAGRRPEPVADWDAARAAPDGTLLALSVELDAGFVDEATGTVAVSAADLLGSRVRSAEVVRSQPLPEFGQDEFRLEDAVVHLDRGMGVLKGIEALQGSEADGADVVRLAYAGDAKLLVPVDEIGKIWRYGAEAEAVTLDRLDGEAWEKRRAKVEAEIAETARKMVDLARERDARSAPKLDASGRDYERFVLRFPFSETLDQTRAIEEVLADLRRGRPMDRLVVGDVGYGKTEVALRAAAAAALAGKQVVVAAPTTVLVRQHLATFRRRFAGLGIEVAGLSRLVKPAEAKAVKAGLKDGSVRIVVGTHALAGKGIAFADLGLVIIDEEQRFGTAHKTKLRELARGVHVLTLTATPIPRTLLSAMVGIHDVSVIATPPARRRPIRTFIAEFDPVTVREALVRENRRGGQSFVVCPRIEDIEPLRERLAELVPELEVLVAHGGLPPDEVDTTMVRFADGDGDVLLATNIIESGLDVPRANTMLVWRADRFGLAQLHQVRGRVGRGRAQGIAYLLTEPKTELAAATRKRLETLATLDRLGAGFALSARDLDIRGAGDLLGEEQAGHMKLIGAGLYRHLLQRALVIAQGQQPPEDWTPEVNIGATGSFPEVYVPEPDLRINLYARLFAAGTARDIDALADEIEDRFGPLPEAVSGLLARVRLGVLCRGAGVARLDAGPQGIALTFRPGALGRPGMKEAVATMGDAAEFRGERLVLSQPSETTEQRQRLAADVLEALS